ncbi:aspartate/glutamate racemase family protein [Alteromonas gracilis]
MPTIGLLHTAQAHVATFDALAGAYDVALVHAVRPDLLARARAGSDRRELEPEVRSALAALTADGVEAVVCTCSTLGPIAEQLGALRIDRPMMAEAVRGGSRVGVVLTLESTMEATLDLLEEEARRHQRDPVTEVRVVPGAWDAFASGDVEGCHALVADTIRELAEHVDLIVLAQASMAGATDLLLDLPVPVLASPRLAVEAAVRLLQDARD